MLRDDVIVSPVAQRWYTSSNNVQQLLSRWWWLWWLLLWLCVVGEQALAVMYFLQGQMPAASDYAEKRRKGKLKQNKQILTPPGDEMAVKRVRFF